jgi:hypothetical protein
VSRSGSDVGLPMRNRPGGIHRVAIFPNWCGDPGAVGGWRTGVVASGCSLALVGSGAGVVSVCWGAACRTQQSDHRVIDADGRSSMLSRYLSGVSWANWKAGWVEMGCVGPRSPDTSAPLPWVGQS